MYGPDKTSTSTPAMFTWSIHCLYATVPGCLLQVLSLWSIYVTSRTQELNIQIPLFCCNVSHDKNEREKIIIEDFLTRAVTELQDLAVIPGIRDPSLNTAECIREGHKPIMDPKGRTAHIRAILWCSLFFAIFSGPLLAKYITVIRDLQENSKSKEKKNTAKAVCFSFYILSLVGISVSVAAFVLSCIYLPNGQATFDIITIIVVIFVYSVVLSIVITVLFCKPYSEEDSRRTKCRLWMKCFFKKCSLIHGANTISYLFCWLIIGTRINLTWGLTIALLVICVSAALTYAIYLYLDNEATYQVTASYQMISARTTSDPYFTGPKQRTTDYIFNHRYYPDRIQVILFCVSGFLAVFLLFVVVVLAGKSYSGEEMAAEVLKTTSLYFISAFISWVTWKKHASDEKSRRPTL